MTLPPCVEVTVTAYGGHCGFIRDRHLGSWAEDYIAGRLAAARARATPPMEVGSGAPGGPGHASGF
jgi:hypothetical protein